MPRKSRAPVSASQKAEHSIIVRQHRITHHEGPLPDPDELAGYDAVIPGLAERIVSMAETEQHARLSGLQSEIKNRRFETIFGRVFAFFYSLAVCGIAVFAIHKDYPGGAALVFGLHVAGVCAKFISNRRQHTPPSGSGRERGN